MSAKVATVHRAYTGALRFSKRRKYQMNLNLRNAIIHNVSGNTQDELKILLSMRFKTVKKKCFLVLGVLFEVIWKNASDQDKQDMLASVRKWLEIIKASEELFY